MNPIEYHPHDCLCSLCMLARTNPEYARLWGKVGNGHPKASRELPCFYRGDVINLCPRGDWRNDVVECDHAPSMGEVTHNGVCKYCKYHSTGGDSMKSLRWAVGVTTVPERSGLLGQTLGYLGMAGFPEPLVCVDGGHHWSNLGNPVGDKRVDSVPRLGVVGNWVNTLWRLLVLHPSAQRYAVFQDDLRCVRNLRAYLDRCPYPQRGYLNLFTFLDNEARAAQSQPGTWFEASVIDNRGFQSGRGAVGLVFDRNAAVTLLSSRSIIEKPLAASNPDRKLDGAVVNAMNFAGYREWCHAPSLLQHTGEVSTMGNHRQPQALSYPGDDFDALSLVHKEQPA